MVSSSLRRTNIPGNGHRFQQLSDEEADGFTVTVVDQEPVDTLCEDYPYDGQSVYRGTIEYEEVAELGGGREIDLQFAYRDGSSLFILESDVDLPSIDAVINRLNALAPNEFVIYRSLTVHRDRLWTFLQEAEQLIEVTLIGDDGDTIDLATFRSHQEGDELGQTELVDIEQYPIQSATVAFEYGDEQIVTRYSDGSLSIQSDTAKAREYIIQLFERDVLDEAESA